MISKIEVVQHVYDIVRLVFILQPEMVEDPDLHQRLVMEALLVADDLDGHLAPGAVVQGSDHLAEGSLANDLEDLVSVGYVVVDLLELSNCGVKWV